MSDLRVETMAQRYAAASSEYSRLSCQTTFQHIYESAVTGTTRETVARVSDNGTLELTGRSVTLSAKDTAAFMAWLQQMFVEAAP